KQISPTDNRSQIEKIFGLGMYDGWVGEITVETYEEGDRAVFDADTTFESESYGETGEPSCRFMTGVVEGMLSYFWDTEVEATETACRCAGDDHCRIEVEN
ncbi:MAG: 4-vinyl reductase, partial [Candidatus Nanohaloarchaea archaeon]|nr:4-vinyl reductase [Candidatus Nanohaloarchaea archaeon]